MFRIKNGILRNTVCEVMLVNDREKLPPLTVPPVPSVPNRAYTEMRKTAGDGMRKPEISAPENGQAEADSVPEIRAVAKTPTLGNFSPGENDGNFAPEKGDSL